MPDDIPIESTQIYINHSGITCDDDHLVSQAIELAIWNINMSQHNGCSNCTCPHKSESSMLPLVEDEWSGTMFMSIAT